MCVLIEQWFISQPALYICNSVIEIFCTATNISAHFYCSESPVMLYNQSNAVLPSNNPPNH